MRGGVDGRPQAQALCTHRTAELDSLDQISASSTPSQLHQCEHEEATTDRLAEGVGL